jgi:MOSC domain-containing protein YiiM/ferredoxin-NADP reductase
MVVKGQSVPTGIFKLPTDTKVAVEKTGIVGDVRVEPRKYGESNHAIHAYPYEHYAYWESILHRDPFPLGQMGENLTVCHLLETEVRIGDIFRIGTCVMQITQPRIPCRKLNVRMGISITSEFLRTRRTGFYLRVIETGNLEKGQEITLLERAENSPTVDEFTRISQFDYWDAEALLYLMKARGLPQEWQSTLHSKLQRAQTAKGWFGQRELKVISRIQECKNVVSLELQCSSGRPLPSFKGGQLLNLVVKTMSNRVASRRCYALTSNPLDPSCYRITIEREESNQEDKSLSAIVYNLQIGDFVRAEAPNGTLTFDRLPPDCERIVVIHQGAGVATALGLLYHWHHEGKSLAFTSIHEGRSPDTHVFREEFETLSQTSPRLQVLNLYKEFADQSSAPAFAHHTQRGEISFANLQPFLVENEVQVFVIGPQGFLDRIVAMIALDGTVPRAHVHTQSLGL